MESVYTGQSTPAPESVRTDQVDHDMDLGDLAAKYNRESIEFTPFSQKRKLSDTTNRLVIPSTVKVVVFNSSL